MSTIVLSKDHIKRVLDFKMDNDGEGAQKSRHLVNLVCMEDITSDEIR